MIMRETKPREVRFPIPLSTLILRLVNRISDDEGHICINNDFLDERDVTIGDDFTIGLSVIFLKFVSPTPESYIDIRMKKYYHDGMSDIKEDSLWSDIEFPTEHYEEKAIFTSFGKFEAPDSNIKRIELKIGRAHV